MKTRFACGSMVLFFLFTKHFHIVKMFCEKKDGFFRPARGLTLFRVKTA